MHSRAVHRACAPPQVWIFVGLPNYRVIVPADNSSCAAGGGAGVEGVAGCSDGSWSSNVVRLDDGSTRATCLNPHATEDHELRKHVGSALAAVPQLATPACWGCFGCLWGGRTLGGSRAASRPTRG